MKPERPPNRDYQITDKYEQALFYYQIEQKALREKIERGEGEKADKDMFVYLDEYIPLMEKFIQEQDPDLKSELREQMRQLQGANKDLIDAYKEVKGKGKFIGFRKIYTGKSVAVFTDWSKGEEILFNRQSLEMQLKHFRDQGKATEELEKALNSWPDDDKKK